jgi:peptidoglycan/xylan/chitin deacetylase (PgdA/CDA1 family)
VIAGGDRLGRAILGTIYGNGHLRAINYHATAIQHRETFLRHLEFYAAHFVDMPREMLGQFFSGEWTPNRPALMLCFDDGEASNYEIAAPLLEEFGFTGYFLVCPSLVGKDGTHLKWLEEAKEFVDPEARDWIGPLSDYKRNFMTWDQVRDLNHRGHAIGSHTLNHIRLSIDVPEEVMRREIIESRRRIEAETGARCNIFCWPGGEASSYSNMAGRLIEDAAYQFAMLSNAGIMERVTAAHRLQRVNVDATWPLYRAKFASSGVIDAAYLRKRRVVNRTLA